MTDNVLYRSDCKEALNDLIDKGVKVDLIYLDPPFNSSRTYNLIYKNQGVTAQQKAFGDMWALTSQNRQMLLQFERILETTKEISELVKNFLKAWIAPLQEGDVQDQKMLVYLMYMTERLVLMKKVLKDTGSIYYHCDPTASHYIKMIMDGIFGRENFRNEIVWCYTQGGRSVKDFPRKHDVILRFSKTKKCFFNPSQIKIPYDLYSKKSSSSFTKQDADGRFYKEIFGPGKQKKYKYYQDEGKTPYDWWTDIHQMTGRTAVAEGSEALGYPTQKPIALLNRIVKASCPKGGMVLDPFCGCGTTIASAIENNADWIGVDISYDAIELIEKRVEKQVGLNSKGTYTLVDGSPETFEEYTHLDPFAKQDWLINKVGGFPNPKKSGDGGVDGELTIHLGIENGLDTWGKMVFSVKTGKQRTPLLVRELIGTVKSTGAAMGGLIVDADPTQGMETLAKSQGRLEYIFAERMPKNVYDKIQILIAQEIIDGNRFSTPPTLKAIRLHRGDAQLHL